MKKKESIYTQREAAKGGDLHMSSIGMIQTRDIIILQQKAFIPKYILLIFSLKF